jgi:hypothetical protein
MSKQKEVRNEVWDIIQMYDCGADENYFEGLTDKIFLYLHSQGVVIQVGLVVPSGEYPLSGSLPSYPIVEPLIEDKPTNPVGYVG